MNIRTHAWYPVVFMFLITAIPSALLIGFSRFTRERVKANEQFALEHAILKAVDPDLPDGLRGVELHTRFEQTVNTNINAAAGAYRLMDNGQVVAYALPFSGRGFWNQISGVIGIKPDLATVTGFYVYEQTETPGLGAQITEPWFRENFVGLTMADGDAPIVFKRAGEAAGPNEVESVTGGTQTSVRLEQFLNERLVEWRAAMREKS
jgi:Na+-transporting NADH:ubiquinone oxidoreductase subunit C